MRKLIAGSLLIAALMLSGCWQDGKTERGLRYMPDMYDSPSVESQDVLVVKELRRAAGPDERAEVEILHVPVMQLPVAGTMSRDYVAHPNDPSPEAGKALANPLQATAEVLRDGQYHFNTYCAVCHGKDGNKDNGYVAAKLMGVLSVNTEAVAVLSDGEIYQIITHGRNRMPAYGAQLLPEERWSVIHYLRALHTATVASGEDKVRFQNLQEEYGEAFRPRPEPQPEYQREIWPERPLTIEEMERPQ